MATPQAADKPATPHSTTQPADPVKAAGKAAPDWERIELDYRAGIKSLREISDGSGVSHVTISKRAKKAGWVRSLTAKIQAKADDLVNKAGVNSCVNAVNAVSERQIVEVNAEAIATIKLAHRKDIHRKRAIVARLMDELEAQVGPENAALLADLGDMLRNPDENGQDKLNDLYRKIISLPERARTAKTLAETLRITVDMERQAFGMDAKGADGAIPGAAGYVPPSIRVVHVTAPARQEDDDAGE